MRRYRWAAAVALLWATAGQARTITLTAEDCDQMAVLSAKAPHMSWAAMPVTTAAFSTEPQVQLWPEMSLLLRFPLDQIPKGQRVTKAELTVPVGYVAGVPQVSVRRLVSDWGHGVSYRHRFTHPRKEEWAKPGGLGASTDRAAKDSALLRIEKAGDHAADVTEDVELWYTGATANRGWILAIENATGPLYFASPYGPHHGAPKQWKLQITFEPQ